MAMTTPSGCRFVRLVVVMPPFRGSGNGRTDGRSGRSAGYRPVSIAEFGTNDRADRAADGTTDSYIDPVIGVTCGTSTEHHQQ